MCVLPHLETEKREYEIAGKEQSIGNRGPLPAGSRAAARGGELRSLQGQTSKTKTQTKAKQNKKTKDKPNFYH